MNGLIKAACWCYVKALDAFSLLCAMVLFLYVGIVVISFMALCSLSAIIAVFWPLMLLNDISFAIGK